jgi:F0F1-type ATP synthase gamma subunit
MDMAETYNVKCMNSSMVHSFSYDEQDQTLRVYFRGGQIYDYFFVPREVADTFKNMCEQPGESAGKWFAQHVRKTFEFQKVA